MCRNIGFIGVRILGFWNSGVSGNKFQMVGILSCRSIG